MASFLVIAVAALTSTVHAQTAGLYAQCGGTGYGGATVCASGSYCLYQNAYYSQCVPGSAGTTLVTSTKASTSATKASTSSTSIKVSSSSTPTTIASTSTSKVATSTQAAATGGYKYLITFGDSYSQTGFDITLAAANPASASNLLSNPTFPGWTTSGGSNWLDFAIAKYNHTLTLSYNLAYGGATTDASLVTPYASTVLSFIDQTTEFSKYLASKPTWAPWTSTNSLFAIWMGVNDVGNAWYLSNWSTLATQIIAKYMSQVQIMYNSGARNFVFLSVPPITRTPSVIASANADSIAQEAAAIVYYNSLLSAAVAQFKANNTGVTTWVFDTTGAFNTVLDNPTAYGAPNNTCYNANGVSCLWFNDYHPGQAIHNLVGKGVAALTGM